MRTTSSLDDDVAALLKQAHKSTKQTKEQKEQKNKRGQTTLKQIVNEALRHGLERMGQPVVPQKPFRTHAVNLGKCYFPNLDNTWEVLAGAEGESRN